MAGSRAADAREPGQIREEAALSDTVRAPRTSLAGADDRRARPRTSLEAGCTVHLAPSMSEAQNLEVVRCVVEHWNSADFEGLLELYHEDTVGRTTEDWPEQAGWSSKEEMRTAIADWRAAWETSALAIDSLETHGDNVLLRGAWTRAVG